MPNPQPRGSWGVFLMLFGWLCPLLAAQQPSSAAQGPLTVGTREVRPFSYQDEAGKWTGLSIELWDQIARQLELEYELRDVSLEELVDGLAAGRLDASVAALTVTPEREQSIDFTHPFHPSGLGLALPHQGSVLWRSLRSLVSMGFLQAVGTLVVLIFAAGALVWFFERRGNPEEFGGAAHRGLGEAFWWSAVTMTTVGYGDKSPRTLGGRIIALIWMFASIITISGLTAAIASTLTVTHMEGDIQGPEDLRGRGRVLTVQDSTAEAWLRASAFPTQGYESVEQALESLRAGRGAGVVYDKPILKYLLQDDPDLDVLPQPFERQDYAFGLPLESSLRKPVNRVLLELMAEPAWEELLEKYGLGR